MFRTLCIFTLSLPAAAATISATADCLDGPVTGQFAAMCTGTGGVAAVQIFLRDVPMAPVSPLLYQHPTAIASIVMDAEHASPSTPGRFMGANAAFAADYWLTVTGGSGAGQAEPCVRAVGYSYFAVAGGSASAFVGGIGRSDSGQSQGNTETCLYPAINTLAFTFGEPLRVAVELSAGAGVSAAFQSTQAGAFFTGFRFFDSGMHQLPNVSFTLTPAEPLTIPEPATGAVAAALLLAAALIRRRR